MPWTDSSLHHRWKLDVSVELSNSVSAQLLYSTEYVEIYPGLYSPVTVPYEQTIETTAITSMVGIKYGVSSWTELYLQVNTQAIWGRDRVKTEEVLDRDLILKNTTIGITQRLLKEAWYPAVFMFLESSPLQSIEFPDHGFQKVNWKQYSSGFMA